MNNYTQYVTPALIAEAYAMLEDGRDYFPNLRNGLPYGELHGLPDSLMLYSYGDSVWLVAHNDGVVCVYELKPKYKSRLHGGMWVCKNDLSEWKSVIPVLDNVVVACEAI